MNLTKYENKLPYFTKGEDEDKFIAWHKEEQRLCNMFNQDLLIELGVEDNPKRDKLLSVAQENGHAYGYAEVYNEALDLVDLIV